jgi:hypothetical protein
MRGLMIPRRRLSRMKFRDFQLFQFFFEMIQLFITSAYLMKLRWGNHHSFRQTTHSIYENPSALVTPPNTYNRIFVKRMRRPLLREPLPALVRRRLPNHLIE